ncbi:unnamed protein product [Amoebophrya sp. A120]|nr:unnamed protein product [Amoebophrya sp. A120]|eukprot:GSA120T00013754001.1
MWRATTSSTFGRQIRQGFANARTSRGSYQYQRRTFVDSSTASSSSYTRTASSSSSTFGAEQTFNAGSSAGGAENAGGYEQQYNQDGGSSSGSQNNTFFDYISQTYVPAAATASTGDTTTKRQKSPQPFSREATKRQVQQDTNKSKEEYDNLLGGPTPSQRFKGGTTGEQNNKPSKSTSYLGSRTASAASTTTSTPAPVSYFSNTTHTSFSMKNNVDSTANDLLRDKTSSLLRANNKEFSVLGTDSRFLKQKYPREFAIFTSIDRDNDGIITEEDLEECLHHYGVAEMTHELFRLMTGSYPESAADLDNDLQTENSDAGTSNKPPIGINFAQFYAHLETFRVLRMTARLRMWKDCIGLGVAGNVAGHMDQAGEVSKNEAVFHNPKTPTALFAFYVPNAQKILSENKHHSSKKPLTESLRKELQRLKRFPVTNKVIDYPSNLLEELEAEQQKNHDSFSGFGVSSTTATSGAGQNYSVHHINQENKNWDLLKVQVEPEVALLAKIEYDHSMDPELLKEGKRKKVKRLIPMKVAAFNDCSLRSEIGGGMFKFAGKLSEKKNWGFGSKGISFQAFPVDKFSKEIAKPIIAGAVGTAKTSTMKQQDEQGVSMGPQYDHGREEKDNFARASIGKAVSDEHKIRSTNPEDKMPSLVSKLWITSYVRRNNEIFGYTVPASINSYLLFYEDLLQWIVTQMNHQGRYDKWEDISELLDVANYPRYCWIALGAGQYTDWGQKHFLHPGDEAVVILYRNDRYPEEGGPSMEIIRNIFDERGKVPEGISSLHQIFVDSQNVKGNAF